MKSSSPSTFTAAGQTITYTFVVTNTGNVPLSNIVVTDPMFADLFPGGRIPCGEGVLHAGESRQCDTASHVLTEAELGTTIVNTATATGEPPTGPPVTDDDTVETPIPEIYMASDITATPRPAAPTPPVGGGLPATGAASGASVLVALMLVAVGVALITLTRLACRPKAG